LHLLEQPRVQYLRFSGSMLLSGSGIWLGTILSSFL
jgi:hypothetical protein